MNDTPTKDTLALILCREENGDDACKENCIHPENNSFCPYGFVVDKLLDAMPLRNSLARIARGRTNSGDPLDGEKARQLARTAMTELGLDW